MSRKRAEKRNAPLTEGAVQTPEVEPLNPERHTPDDLRAILAVTPDEPQGMDAAVRDAQIDTLAGIIETCTILAQSFSNTGNIRDRGQLASCITRLINMKDGLEDPVMAPGEVRTTPL